LGILTIGFIIHHRSYLSSPLHPFIPGLSDLVTFEFLRHTNTITYLLNYLLT